MAAPVAFNNLISAVLKVPGGEIFSVLADELFLGHGQSIAHSFTSKRRHKESVEKWLLAYCEFLRKIEARASQFLNVYILESQDSNALHKSICSVDVPNPDIFHV